jgi:hypothetical protein
VRVKLEVVTACLEDDWRRLAPSECSAAHEKDREELSSG